MNAFIKVFKNPAYIFCALLVAIVVFGVAAWVRNIELLWDTIGSSAFFYVLWGTAVSAGGISFATTVAVAILFGINIALFIYAYRERTTAPKGTIPALGGFISGVFGIGCASCGSFLLGSFLASIGASWFLAYLPFHGAEFGFLAIILLLISISWLCKSIIQGNTCSV